MGIDDRLRDRLTDDLFEAILVLKNKDECYRFFEDIATIAEIKALAQRLSIAEATGASTATISRVKRCLFFGADGYQLVLSRISQDQEKTAKE